MFAGEVLYFLLCLSLQGLSQGNTAILKIYFLLILFTFQVKIIIIKYIEYGTKVHRYLLADLLNSREARI